MSKCRVGVKPKIKLTFYSFEPKYFQIADKRQKDARQNNLLQCSVSVNGYPWSWLKLISLKKWMAGGGNNNFSPIAQAKK